MKQSAYQMRLLNQRVKIEEALKNSDDETTKKLQLAKKILNFAKEHGLETEDSYQTFVKLDGSAVSYLVQASEVDRFEAVTWWFPFVGTVPYLGFFEKTERDEKAAELKAKGYDVSNGEVDAFSSLGWFSDPIYSPMLDRSESDLAHLLFHELTHRTVWIKGSVEFNENLAEFVAEKLVPLYLKKEIEAAKLSEVVKKYEDRRQDLLLFHRWLRELRKVLEGIYLSNQSKDQKLKEKEKMIAEFTANRRPAFKTGDFVSKKIWNNASILGSTLYSPDRSRFETAAACLQKADALSFLNRLKSEIKRVDDPFKALDNFCKND